MKCLRRDVVVNVMDIIRNSYKIKICFQKELAKPTGPKISKVVWAHREIGLGRFIKGLCLAEVEGARGRGRPKKRWAVGVGEPVEGKDLSLLEGVRRARLRNE